MCVKGGGGLVCVQTSTAAEDFVPDLPPFSGGIVPLSCGASAAWHNVKEGGRGGGGTEEGEVEKGRGGWRESVRVDLFGCCGGLRPDVVGHAPALLRRLGSLEEREGGREERGRG